MKHLYNKERKNKSQKLRNRVYVAKDEVLWKDRNKRIKEYVKSKGKKRKSTDLTKLGGITRLAIEKGAYTSKFLCEHV